MNNLAFYLAQIYYNLTGQIVNSIPTGFTDSFWAERIFRYAAGFPDNISGGKNASFWLEAWYYKRTGQNRLATGTLPAWFWLAKLYDQVLRGSAHNPNGQVGYNSAEFWASQLATLAFAPPTPPFNPVTDLAWGLALEAELTGAYQDTARTIPAGQGDPVGSWTDGSGNNRHPEQSTAIIRPILTTDNGVICLSFGGNFFLQKTGFVLNNPNTVILVSRLAALGGTYLFFDSAAGANRNAMFTTTNQFHSFAGNTLSNGAEDTNWHVWTLIFNGAGSVIRKDGVQVATGDAGTQNMDGVTVAAQFAGILALNGMEHALFVSDLPMLLTDIQRVENYYLNEVLP